MSKPQVAVLVGSDSDLPTIEYGLAILRKLNIAFELHISSAHRTPKQTIALVSSAQQKGFRVIIAAAGMSAHLAGVVAAHTLLPVIGIPMDGKLDGLDALLSTVQMPPGIPVATMAIGKPGAINAALFAAEILALSDTKVAKALRDYRQEMTQEVLKKNMNIKV